MLNKKEDKLPIFFFLFFDFETKTNRNGVFDGDDLTNNFCNFLFVEHNSVWMARNGTWFDDNFR